MAKVDKIFYEALQKLPDLYVDEGTKVVVLDKNHVLGMHYQFGAILYSSESKEWKKLQSDNKRSEHAQGFKTLTK